MKNKFSSKILTYLFFILFAAVVSFIFSGVAFSKETVVSAEANYTVTVSVNDSTMGSYSVVALDKNGNSVDFISGNAYEVGTRLTISAIENDYYQFNKFVINDTNYYDACQTVEIVDKNVNIQVVFETKKYELAVSIRDSEFNVLSNKPFVIDIEYAGVSDDTPLVKYIRIGDRIKSIKLSTSLQVENYKFVGWYIQGEDRNPVEFIVPATGIVIDENFVDNYYRDGKITIYGKFVQMCSLNIFVPEEYKVDSNYMLYIRQGFEYYPVTELEARYEYGTEFKIIAAPLQNYQFVGFNGDIDDENYIDGAETLVFTMNNDKTIALNYQPNKVQIKLDLTKVSDGKILSNSESLAVGDTLILSYELRASRKIGKFNINGKTTKEFASAINEIAGAEVAFAKDGVVSIYVNDNVYNYLSANKTLSVEAVSSTNVVFVLLITLYILLAVGFGAAIITFTILHNRIKRETGTLTRKQAAVIKEKQQKYLEEKAVEEKNEVAKQAEDDSKVEKPKAKTQKVTKKPVAKKSAAKTKTSATKKTASNVKKKTSAGSKAAKTKTTTKSRQTKKEGK